MKDVAPQNKDSCQSTLDTLRSCPTAFRLTLMVSPNHRSDRSSGDIEAMPWPDIPGSQWQ